MNVAHILYFVISMSGSGSVALTSITSEHSSQSTCETALTILRQTLADGKVILAKCSPK